MYSALLFSSGLRLGGGVKRAFPALRATVAGENAFTRGGFAIRDFLVIVVIADARPFAGVGGDLILTWCVRHSFPHYKERTAFSA